MSLEHKKYLIYVVKYLGVALIAGSVVHVGTLHNGTTRYIVLGIIGLFLMVLGNLIEARQNGEKIDTKYLGIITGLSLATGFLSGGIQHYLDNPGYAGYLLATGLLFSYVIFFLKDKIKVVVRNVVIVAGISAFILIASRYVPIPGNADHHATVVSETATTTTVTVPVQPLVEDHNNPHAH